MRVLKETFKRPIDWARNRLAQAIAAKPTANPSPQQKAAATRKANATAKKGTTGAGSGSGGSSGGGSSGGQGKHPADNPWWKNPLYILPAISAGFFAFILILNAIKAFVGPTELELQQTRDYFQTKQEKYRTQQVEYQADISKATGAAPPGWVKSTDHSSQSVAANKQQVLGPLCYRVPKTGTAGHLIEKGACVVFENAEPGNSYALSGIGSESPAISIAGGDFTVYTGDHRRLACDSRQVSDRCVSWLQDPNHQTLGDKNRYWYLFAFHGNGKIQINTLNS